MRTAALVVFLVMTTGNGIHAAISADVTPSHSIYDTLDRLEAHRCAYPTFRALKPRSFQDLRAATDGGEGSSCGDKNTPAWIVLERQRLLYPKFPGSIAATAMLLPTDDFTPLSGIDAVTTPLLPLREGRPTAGGGHLFLEPALVAESGLERGFAFGITPGFVASTGEGKNTRGLFYLQEGFLKAGYKQVELTAGRLPKRFGDGKHGSLLLSGAAKPMDLVQLTLRPIQYGFTVETWTSFNYDTNFFALSVGARPVHWLEVALLELYQFGGAGRPKMEAGDFLKMLFYSGADELTPKRQRTFAAHLGFWLFNQKAKLYGQTSFDKPEEGGVSFLGGVYAPRVGEFDLRFETAYTAPVAYQSAVFRRGLTFDKTPLGHPLGPDGLGLYADIGLPEYEGWKVSLNGTIEKRARALLNAENRMGGGVDVRKMWNQTELAASVRVHQVENLGYVLNQNAALAAGQLFLRYYFY